MFRKYMFTKVANDESSSTYVRWLMMIKLMQEFKNLAEMSITLYYFICEQVLINK